MKRLPSMMRSMATALALACASASLGACSIFQAASTASSTMATQSQINDARATLYGLESVYGATLSAAVDWAKQSTCAPGVPAPPLCSTPAGIVAIAKAQLAVSAALTNAKKVILAATPDSSALSLAISTAQGAYATYTSALATYGVKTGT